MLAGCAQQVLAPDINAATVRVLTRNHIEVVIPKSMGCCGALAWHVGNGDEAMAFARRLIDSVPSDVDALIINAAGCGSAVHEYPLLLAVPSTKNGRVNWQPSRWISRSFWRVWNLSQFRN